MTFVRLLPVLISFLLLAAHFSRADNTPMVAASLIFPLILLVRKPWVAPTVQVVLVLGGLVWIRRAAVLVGQRQASGESWTRLAVILAIVAAFTMASALVFRSTAVKKYYGAPVAR
jgi:hypothetical protein